MRANGDIINDSHAEVMCRRGFIRYIYNEIKCSDKVSSIFHFDESSKKFALNKNISFHLFSTHAPCGDASIFEIPVEHEDNDDIPTKKPKLISNIGTNDNIGDSILLQTDEAKSQDNFTGAKIVATNFNVPLDLMTQTKGLVRTKPGRGDHTLSMSCSDKIAKWNVMGIQGALLHSLIGEPIYLESITFCGARHCDVEAAERAIWERFESNMSKFDRVGIKNPIVRICNDFRFKHEKSEQLEPSPSSIVWCKVPERAHEVAVAGKRQGVTKSKLNTRSGRLLITKVELLKSYVSILRDHNEEMKIFPTGTDFAQLTYSQAKGASVEYQQLWLDAKTNYFKVWTVKPSGLDQFTARD